MKNNANQMPDNARLRIDKWLWAARFFKTRTLAADAIDSGRVMVDDTRIKPAKTIGIGDTLTIRLGPYLFEVEVLALSDKRGSAPQAQKLYRETEQGRSKREALVAEIKSQPKPFDQKGRPTKRDRREIDRLKIGAW